MDGLCLKFSGQSRTHSQPLRVEDGAMKEFISKYAEPFHNMPLIAGEISGAIEPCEAVDEASVRGVLKCVEFSEERLYGKAKKQTSK
jgi:hypothetical protein